MNPLRNPLRSFLRSAARFLRQSRCKHVDTLRKTEGKRMFTECLRCEYQSKGVEIAGHDYASTKWSWEPGVRRAVELDPGITAVLVLPKPLPPVAIAPDFDVHKALVDAFHNRAGRGCIPTIAPEPAQPNKVDIALVNQNELTAPEPATPVLGNLAGHATRPRRKITPQNLRRAVNKALSKPKKRQRKISAIKPRKTSRKPSSKRSKTA